MWNLTSSSVDFFSCITTYYLLFTIDFYWSIVDLWCCVSCCCTAKLISYEWVSESLSVMSDSASAWTSPGQNIGVGSRSLLQGIFPTQGSNPGLPHCRHLLYQLSHQGSPRIPEWVAYSFSSGSSQARNQTRVSYIAGGFFTSWVSSW